MNYKYTFFLAICCFYQKYDFGLYIHSKGVGVLLPVPNVLVSFSCFNFLYLLHLYYYFRAFRANSDVWTLLYPYVLYPFTHIAMGGTIFMTMAISIGKKNCPQNIGPVHSLLIFFPLFYRTVFGTMSPIIKPA